MGVLARLCPAPLLERITARVLAIDAADDERDPPETGLTAAALAAFLREGG